MPLSSLLLVVAGYLVGSLSFAVIVSRAMGLPDPHSYGSGNPGATNVLRTGNKAAAVLTLLGDAIKGWVVVVAGRWLAQRYGFSEVSLSLAGLAAFVGHLFPVFFGFRGGKGVATAGGVLLGLNPLLGAGVLVVWIGVFALGRISSLAALAAAVAAPAGALLLYGIGVPSLVVAVMAGLLVWRHKDNIRKLRSGTERRVGAR